MNSQVFAVFGVVQENGSKKLNKSVAFKLFKIAIVAVNKKIGSLDVIIKADRFLIILNQLEKILSKNHGGFDEFNPLITIDFLIFLANIVK